MSLFVFIAIHMGCKYIHVFANIYKNFYMVLLQNMQLWTTDVGKRLKPMQHVDDKQARGIKNINNFATNSSTS